MIQQDCTYFETQGKLSLQCGRHSLNNVLGQHRFTQDRMNQLCKQLSPSLINPHKHIFGGDYDINVMMLALQQEDCSTRWHDRRQKFQISPNPNGRQLIGFLINKYRKTTIFHTVFRVSPRHWIAVRKHGDKYQFMDSKETDFQIFKREQAEKRINEFLSEFNDAERRAQVIEVYRDSA